MNKNDVATKSGLIKLGSRGPGRKQLARNLRTGVMITAFKQFRLDRTVLRALRRAGVDASAQSAGPPRPNEQPDHTESKRRLNTTAVPSQGTASQGHTTRALPLRMLAKVGFDLGTYPLSSAY